MREVAADKPDDPNEALATKVIAELVNSGLITSTDGDRIRSALAAGKLDGAGWKLAFENRIEGREAER